MSWSCPVWIMSKHLEFMSYSVFEFNSSRHHNSQIARTKCIAVFREIIHQTAHNSHSPKCCCCFETFFCALLFAAAGMQAFNWRKKAHTHTHTHTHTVGTNKWWNACSNEQLASLCCAWTCNANIIFGAISSLELVTPQWHCRIHWGNYEDCSISFMVHIVAGCWEMHTWNTHTHTGCTKIDLHFKEMTKCQPLTKPLATSSTPSTPSTHRLWCLSTGIRLAISRNEARQSRRQSIHLDLFIHNYLFISRQWTQTVNRITYPKREV